MPIDLLLLDALFVLLVGVLLPIRAWRRHLRGAPPAPTTRYVGETLLLTTALAALIWRHGVPPEAIGLRAAPAARQARDVAICLLAVLGPDVWLVWRITRRARRAAALPPPDGVVADVIAARRELSRFVLVASVGAVWEELCYRAAVFLLVPRTPAGLLLGIAAGSLAFGAAHLRNGRVGMAYASAFGVLFSLLYLVTGNLPAVVLAHAAGNVLTVWQWAPRIERARRAALGEALPGAPSAAAGGSR